MKTLKIGNIELKNPFILAPMVDVTDLPFRILCRKHGASLAYTEMIYADAITHENKKTKLMLKTNAFDSPKAVQITANSAEELRKALPHLKKFDIIDLNCGCPSVRIRGTKAGAYLLNNPEKIIEFINILKSTGKIVTAKIRLGYSKNNVIDISKSIESAGADAITIHARLASQSYSVPAQWEQIKLVKQNLKIPVIGNGDVSSPEQAIKMLKETGCDAVMIARSAIGNPSIFKQCIDFYETGKYSEIDFKEKIKLFNEYIQLSKKYNISDLKKIKYVGSQIIRGVQGSANLRDKLMQLKRFEDIENFASKINM